MALQIQPQLYFNGDDYYQAVIAEIDKAQTEVLVESYIFDLDPVGIRIFQSLIKARQRGVKIFLLVDGIGSFNWLTELEERSKKNQIFFRAYHPLPFHRRSLKSLSWKNLRRFLLIFRQINKRLHRKVILIDRSVLFLGSFNISQCHSQEFMGEKAWRDTGVRLIRPDLTETASTETVDHSLSNKSQRRRKKKLYHSSQDFHIVVQAFFNAWSRTKLARIISAKQIRQKMNQMVQGTKKITNQMQDILKSATGPENIHLENKKTRFSAKHFIRLNSKARWRYLLLWDLRKKLKSAKHRILITNAYFIPRQSFLRNLRKASRRGVYVALCLPAVTDVKVVQWASRSLYYRLLKDGVHIFEYQNRVLHAKTLIIDDWATVGSHNLNHRSLNHDLEIEWVTENPPVIKSLIQHWDQDIQHSHAITMADLGRWTVWDRIIGRVAYWFRYWI